MKICGWGRYPTLDSTVHVAFSESDCVKIVSRQSDLIARGMGRSYGDSSLARNVLLTRHIDNFVEFNIIDGLLTCEAGLSFDEILQIIVPKGYFFPVTPGTRYISIGGAIASDVHGKNHHTEGSFCDYITKIELLLGNGERIAISSSEYGELFRATCGGMGLTGVILSATFKLKPISSSNIAEKLILCPNIEATLSAFDEYSKSTYSVAWVDCLSHGKKLGRSILMLGEHANDGVFELQNRSKYKIIPFDMPSALLNRGTATIFNNMYYAAAASGKLSKQTIIESYFYPLDAIQQWNRLYGRNGFIQYQFALPRAAGLVNLRYLLSKISDSGRGAFLAVLKAFGKANQNLLSFPIEGYTLALDFKMEQGLFEFLDEMDRIIVDLGGRIYLAKDSRMSESTFKAGYPHWPEFEDIRAKYHATGKFSSNQSRRLGLQ